MPNPAMPQGTSLFNGAIGSCFPKPSTRRFNIPIVPIKRTSPTKCKSIMIGHHLFLCADAGHERRNRQESHAHKNDKAASPNFFGFYKERDEEQPDSNHRADDRKVIEQKM